MACRLCQANSLELFLELPKSPPNISRLLSLEELGSSLDSPVSLKVWRCKQCGFTQLLDPLPSNFYQNYIMATTFSSKIKRLHDEEAHKFLHYLKSFGPNLDNSVLEIGCGDGTFMRDLSGFAPSLRIDGVEPSKTFRDKISGPFTIFPDYVSSQTVLGPYDGVVFREVLEHIWDIHEFLQGVRNVLRPGGIGMLEVPCLEKTLRDDRFYDFFMDHPNYFSSNTLTLALSMHGMEIFDCAPYMDGEYNVAFFRRLDLFSGLPQSVTDITESIKNIAIQCQEKKVFWGAGGKGISLLAAIPPTSSVCLSSYFDYVVDDDLNKIGKYTPVSNRLVEDPSILWQQEKPIGVIVVSAMAYIDEIVSKIRTAGFAGPVYAIGKQGLYRV